MTDLILQVTTQHLQERYPHLHITLNNVNTATKMELHEYIKLEYQPPTKQFINPHCYIYHNNATLVILNKYFQDTYIDLAHPDSTTQLHDTIHKLLELP